MRKVLVGVVLLSVCVNAQMVEAFPQDYISYWKFEERIGDTAPDETGANDGTLMNNAQIVSDNEKGNVLSLDGINSYVETGFNSDLSAFTVAAWTKGSENPKSDRDAGPIMREKNFNIFYDHMSDRWRGAAGSRINGVWINATFRTLNPDTWYHLAATYDGIDLKAYKNGVLISTYNASGAPDSESNTAKIGRHAVRDEYWNGRADDVMIYSRALSENEIFQIYDETRPEQPLGPTYYVSMSGNDNNPGTFLQPFRTIEKARDTIRTTGEDGVTVYIRGGVYEISQTIRFDSRDSGSPGSPNVYQVYPGEEVRIAGGIELKSSDFSVVTSGSTPNVWSRTDDNAKGHLMQLDLSAYTTDYGTLLKRGSGAKNIAALELFFNQEPMELARWPNRVENEDVDMSIHNLTVVGEGINPDVTGIYDYAGEHNDMPYYKLRGGDWYMWMSKNNLYYITNTLGGGQGSSQYHWICESGIHEPRGAYHVDYGPATGNPLAIPEISGFEIIASTTDDTHFTYFGTRPERWGNAEEIWIHGYFGKWWSDSHIKVDSINTNTKVITLESAPKYYGIKRGQAYYAENLLEEIDIPGEWYLNRNTGILYFWPPGDNINGEIYVSVMKDELVNLENVDYMTFKDIIFETGRSRLVYIEDGSHCTLEDCVVRNAGTDGVGIEYGSNHGVEGCEVYGTGETGVNMRGGDRLTLTPASHFVRNSHIHHFGRWIWTYMTAVRIGDRSVGHEVSHNHIHDAPHAGILYAYGNDHLIEYNEIHNVLEWCNDCGAIYTWPTDWGSRGTVIRYNFIHHLDSPFPGIGLRGVYLDDGASGQTVFGNILYYIEGFGICHNGGRDDLIENNVMAKCGYGLYASSRAISYYNCDPTDPDYIPHRDFLNRLNSEGIDYQSPPWSTKYPELAAIPKDCDQLENSHWIYPEDCVLSRNLGWQSKYNWTYESNYGGNGTFNKFKEILDNIENQDPLFVDEANLDMNMQPDSPAYDIPGFQGIPFDQIGIILAIIDGDLNNDGFVGIDDLIMVATHFGLIQSSPNWNETADVIPNSEIDIYDVVFIASRFT